MSRELAAKQDAAMQQAYDQSWESQRQSLPVTEAAPTMFAPDQQPVVVTSDPIGSAPQQQPPESAKYSNPPVPMSVSPPFPEYENFISPMEDRSTLLQSLAQPTRIGSDTEVSAPVRTPWRRRAGFCITFKAIQQCEKGNACGLSHDGPPATTRRQLSFERSPAPLRDPEGSSNDPVGSYQPIPKAAPIQSSPTPLQKELDTLKAQLDARDKELEHAQSQLHKFQEQEKAAKGPSDSNHHYIGDEDDDYDHDDEEEIPYEEWEDDYQDPDDYHSPESDQKAPIQEAPAVANRDTAVSAAPFENTSNQAHPKDVSIWTTI